jgi:hypothetical protein
MGIKEAVMKDFGNDIILSGNSIVDKKSVVIPVSPALDMVLNTRGQFCCFNWSAQMR